MLKKIIRNAMNTGMFSFYLLMSVNVDAVVVTLDVDESADPPILHVSNNNALDSEIRIKGGNNQD